VGDSYDFNGKNLTPYGGLLPAITMLEKLGFQSLVEQTVTSKRIPRAMDLYRFVLGIMLGLYIGFPRLNQLHFIAGDPILTGILKVTKLPVQSSFWRFVNALHRNVARQLLTIMRIMRERVWEAANVKLEVVTIDTDTTVHTLYGQQMGGRERPDTRSPHAPRTPLLALRGRPGPAPNRSSSAPVRIRSRSSAENASRLTRSLPPPAAAGAPAPGTCQLPHSGYGPR